MKTRALIWLGLLAAATGVQAQDASALRVRALAATCANCHGTDGRAVDGSGVPGLGRPPARHNVAPRKAINGGARQATVMHQLAKGYSDAQIEQLAAYFAAQKK